VRLPIALMRLAGYKWRIQRRTPCNLSPSTCALFLFFAVLLIAAAPTVRAQDEPPIPVDPTPLAELISAREKAALGEAHGPRKAVEVCLEISDAHLEGALTAIKANDTHMAERELDIYNKACAGALKAASEQRDVRRALAKRIEQHLYKQIRALESIKMLFPEERVAFAEAALKQAKQLRVRALNEAFASGDILQDPTKPKPNGPPHDKTGPANGKPPLPPARILSHTGALKDQAQGFLPHPRGAGRGVSASQLPNDYLSEEEDDHVREAQEADSRLKVFMKIADRRLALIIGPPPVLGDKKSQKKADEELREWGSLPTLSHAELLRHYARAIDECMAKLDDAYERNPKSSALVKALNILRDSTDRHLQTLHSLEAQMKDESEGAALKHAIEVAETANKGARDGLKKKG